VDCCSAKPAPLAANARVTRDAPAWKRATALIAAVVVALLPKCPACWSVYAGLSSVLGVSFVIEMRHLVPLTVASLALALVSLAIVARRSRRPLPFALGALCALGVWAGKFELGSDALTLVALLGLIGASLAARRAEQRRTRCDASLGPGSELAEHAEAR
jgi:hypothetical protein